jgi:hypothetical protein
MLAPANPSEKDRDVKAPKAATFRSQTVLLRRDATHSHSPARHGHQYPDTGDARREALSVAVPARQQGQGEDAEQDRHPARPGSRNGPATLHDNPRKSSDTGDDSDQPPPP